MSQVVTGSFMSNKRIASITELRLKNFWCYLRFIPHAMKSHRQASRSPGLISISVKSEGLLIQRTLTVWTDETAMMQYVRSGAHLAAMKVFRQIANRSFTHHFEIDSSTSWDEALQILKVHGRSHG